MNRKELLQAVPLGGVALLAGCNPTSGFLMPSRAPDGLPDIDPRLPITHLRLSPDTSVSGVTSYDIALPDPKALATGGYVSFEDHRDCMGSCSWDKSGCHFILGTKRWPDPGIGMWYQCKDGKKGHAFNKEHTCPRCRGGTWSKDIDMAQYTPKLGWRYEFIPTPNGFADWSRHKIIDWLKKYDFFPWQNKIHGEEAHGGRLTDLYKNPLVDSLFTSDSFGYINSATVTVWSSNQEWPGGKHTFSIKLRQQAVESAGRGSEQCTVDWLVFAGLVAGIALAGGVSWTVAGAGALVVATVALVAAVQQLHVDGCINK